jgi:hypothetical protein
MKLFFCISSVLVFSLITLFGFSALYIPTLLVLILVSINYKYFWLVVAPTLIIQSGFEKTVYYDRDLSFYSLFDISLIPDLWLVVFTVRSAAYIFSMSSTELPKISKKTVLLVCYMCLSLVIGTLCFVDFNQQLHTFNKAPIKFTLFILIGGIVFSEVKNKNASCIIDGLLIAVILGALLRLIIIIGSDVKDPGIYTFTGVFISVFMFLNASKLDNSFPKSKIFWFCILILHLSVSRTEIILFAFAFVLLLINLKGQGKNYILQYLLLLILVPVSLVLIADFIPGNIANYFMHKLSFFSSYEDGVDLGNSALVRLYTFFNLLAGETSNIFNNITGYGFLGYINFDEFYTSSVLSEGAFSVQEIKSNQYYKLHFFLNNIIFYFGALGFFLYNYIFYQFYKYENSNITLIIISYAYLNVFFRPELAVLFPIVLYVFSMKYKSYQK